mgnify:CR=1 FL=1
MWQNGENRKVFTLQSIKSRIETSYHLDILLCHSGFLLYSPLNQGLKLGCDAYRLARQFMFLLYSPLNQGLKHLRWANLRCANLRVFTLQSIKSRIETEHNTGR